MSSWSLSFGVGECSGSRMMVLLFFLDANVETESASVERI